MGQFRGGWTTKSHLVASDARTALTVALSPGQAREAPEGRTLLQRVGRMPRPVHLLMDRVYAGDAAAGLGLRVCPVVPPKQNRLTPWEYDRALDKRRNEIARLFRRLKGFRRRCSQCEQLDVRFVAFINFALSVEGLR
jgi:transposase